jgi:hypothetical protein
MKLFAKYLLGTASNEAVGEAVQKAMQRRPTCRLLQSSFSQFKATNKRFAI